MPHATRPLQTRFLIPVIVLPVLLVIASVVMLLGDLQAQKERTRLELSGIAYVEKLQWVLFDLQQIRGLFEILRHGDTGVAVRFATVSQRLARNLETLRSAPEAETFAIRAEVDALAGSLLEFVASLPADSDFAAYGGFTEFVDKTRDLILLAASNSYLTLDPELDSYYLVDLLINRLPSLVESIGRLRGAGAGLIAADALDEAGVQRLERRIEAVRVEVDHVDRDLRLVFDRNAHLQAALTPRVEKAQAQLAQLLEAAADLAWTLDSGQDAVAFFDLGTVTVSICRDLCQQVRAELRQMLERRIDGLQRRMLISAAALTGALLIAALLIRLFYLRERRLLAQVFEERELSTTLLDNLPSLFYLVDETGRFVRWNREFERISGYGRDEIAGLNPQRLVPADQQDLVQAKLAQAMGEGNMTVEVDFLTKSGRRIPIYATAFRLQLGGRPHLVGFALDISDRKALEARLEKMAVTDSLTGAFNRARFDDDLQTDIEQAKRYNRRLTIIALDVDRFKQINDTFGHGVGDQVLQAVVEVVQREIRRSDTLYRCGGEEFIIILPETGLAGATEMAERVRRAVAGHDFGEAGRISISLGVAEFRSGEERHHLMKRADDALYAAKQGGRDRTEIAA